MPHEPFVRVGNLHAVPSLHGRWRFAALVRAAFFAERPSAIAVELPETLRAGIEQGIARLPYLSVVAYQDFDQELAQVRQILPITPEDSLIEAVRLGKEFGVPVHFIDRDVLGHQPEPIRVPDDYLIERLGLEAYWRRVGSGLSAPESGSVDDLREQQMAAALAGLAAAAQSGPGATMLGGPVLFVCGLAHLNGVIKHLQARPRQPPGAVTQREQALYTVARESISQVLGDTPYFAYALELARRGLQPEEYPQLQPLPDAKGQELAAAQDAWRDAETALLQRLQALPTGPGVPEDYALVADLIRGASRLYEREWNEQPSPSRLTTLSRYARNLALVGRALTPSRFQLILAAQSTVNDDYAYQALRMADHYPFFEQDSDLPEMKIEGEAGEADGEQLVLRLRMPRALREEEGEQGTPELGDRPQELQAGSWEERWEDGEHHVSHLPQDTHLERFFQYIRDKCKKLLSDQQVRTQELRASLMDGLDLRESLRNLPLGKLYVREYLPGVAEVGPVVVIFHKPGEQSQYPHEQMWFAEHPGESDLALYSTRPGQQFDGPGMSRCHYGGVLSLYPPTGRAQVWGNPRYAAAPSQAEVLLKAAIDLSRKPIVAYVAAQGPSPEALALAASRGIRILYLPLDSLSADTLKRVRTFHVLADRELRPLAPLYLN